MTMDLFLIVDEYLSKKLEDLRVSFSGTRGSAFRREILKYEADSVFNKDQVSQLLRTVANNACDFYDKWLKIFRESPGFFVKRNKRLDFAKVIDNIGNRNKAIIKSFVSDVLELLDRKMERENLAEVERDTLVEWLSEV